LELPGCMSMHRCDCSHHPFYILGFHGSVGNKDWKTSRTYSIMSKEQPNVGYICHLHTSIARIGVSKGDESSDRGIILNRTESGSV
jgi:hypothetical protein